MGSAQTGASAFTAGAQDWIVKSPWGTVATGSGDDEKGDSSLRQPPAGATGRDVLGGGPQGGFRCARRRAAQRPTNLRQAQDGAQERATDQAEDQAAGRGGLDEVRAPERENVHSGRCEAAVKDMNERRGEMAKVGRALRWGKISAGMLMDWHGSAADDARFPAEKRRFSVVFSDDLIAHAKQSGYNGVGWLSPMCGQGVYQGFVWAGLSGKVT